jgi:hypothetical protein
MFDGVTADDMPDRKNRLIAHLEDFCEPVRHETETRYGVPAYGAGYKAINNTASSNDPNWTPRYKRRSPRWCNSLQYQYATLTIPTRSNGPKEVATNAQPDALRQHGGEQAHEADGHRQTIPHEPGVVGLRW